MSRKIAILLPTLAGGGVERLALMLGEEFLGRGFDVEFVVCRDKGNLHDQIPTGASLVFLHAPRARNILRPLIQYFREARPDSSLVSIWPLTWIAILARMLSRSDTTLIVSEHSDLRHSSTTGRHGRSLLRLLGKKVYGLADRLVVVSSGVGKSLEQLCGLEGKDYTVINNPARRDDGIALDDEDRELAQRWKATEHALIAIGNFKPAKDYPTLIRALAIANQSSSLSLLIVGQGHGRAEVERLARDHGIEDKVHIAGFRSDPFPLLREADLLVLSSQWEGFGMVLVEAFRAGVNACSTDCPSGPAEVLANGKYGVLAPVGDPEALASGILEALANPLNADLLRKRAIEFDPEKIAAQYLEYLCPHGQP